MDFYKLWYIDKFWEIIISGLFNIDFNVMYDIIFLGVILVLVIHAK